MATTVSLSSPTLDTAMILSELTSTGFFPHDSFHNIMFFLAPLNSSTGQICRYYILAAPFLTRTSLFIILDNPLLYHFFDLDCLTCPSAVFDSTRTNWAVFNYVTLNNFTNIQVYLCI